MLVFALGLGIMLAVNTPATPDDTAECNSYGFPWAVLVDGIPFCVDAKGELYSLRAERILHEHK